MEVARRTMTISEVTKIDGNPEQYTCFEERKKCVKHSSKKQKKKRKKPRNHPYSSKNFLLRPKINAPANTTQFLCADKEYYLIDEGCQKNQNPVRCPSISNSESEYSFSSCSTSTDSSSFSGGQNDHTSYDNVFWDSSDPFFIKEFDRMYDDIRVELLCSESVEQLTSRCVELESAVHNLQYLLQKEIGRRQKMEEILFLKQTNAKLRKENEILQKHAPDVEVFNAIAKMTVTSKDSNSQNGAIET